MTDHPAAKGAQSAAAAGSPRLQASTSAVLDEAHLGDIEGALGRISVGDIGERHSWKQRLVTLAAIVGPGIIVMVGDNDAGACRPTPKPGRIITPACSGPSFSSYPY